ncbi:MAG: (Fe-S)-binding protein [Verrucomicrobiae bacterium]
MKTMTETKPEIALPGLDCGACGYHTCEEMSERLATDPDYIERCINLSPSMLKPAEAERPKDTPPACQPLCGGCASPAGVPQTAFEGDATFTDSLRRPFDFYLEHFPEDPGPREIMIPHNPMLTRELEIEVGDTLIGRPLGMSCGCPITHCGVAINVDKKTGVIVWCVTGPLNPRQNGYKDLGYYIAEGYEGMVHQTQADLKIGMRYFFQPRMCMLQWRHSGLLNYINRTAKGYQVRLEGLWIG